MPRPSVDELADVFRGAVTVGRLVDEHRAVVGPGWPAVAGDVLRAELIGRIRLVTRPEPGTWQFGTPAWNRYESIRDLVDAYDRVAAELDGPAAAAGDGPAGPAGSLGG